LHTITNAGNDPTYGLGYAWSQPFLQISAGDSITWSWRAPAGIPNVAFRLAQVQDAKSVIENGFSSGPLATSTGSFTTTFHQPGVYAYWSDYVDSERKITLRGTVTVLPASSLSFAFSVHVNGIEAQMLAPNSSVVAPELPLDECPGSAKKADQCGDYPESYLETYVMTFTRCVGEPVIVTDVYPQYVSFDDDLVVEGEGFSELQCENEVYIGGVLCKQTPGNWTTSQLFCRLGMGSGLAQGADHQVEVLVKNFGYALHSDTFKVTFMPKVRRFLRNFLIFV